MLRPEHIRKLRLDKYRLQSHVGMPPPAYSVKRLTHFYSAVGDAAISELFNVSPEVFESQLSAAREYGVSYLYETPAHKIVGVSTAVSRIKDNNILSKNIVLPRGTTGCGPYLSNHYILGIFVKGNITEESQDISDIIVAGWTDSAGVQEDKVETLPSMFSSKLPVVMVPCAKLKPMSDLVKELTCKDDK